MRKSQPIGDAAAVGGDIHIDGQKDRRARGRKRLRRSLHDLLHRCHESRCRLFLTHQAILFKRRNRQAGGRRRVPISTLA